MAAHPFRKILVLPSAPQDFVKARVGPEAFVERMNHCIQCHAVAQIQTVIEPEEGTVEVPLNHAKPQLASSGKILARLESLHFRFGWLAENLAPTADSRLSIRLFGEFPLRSGTLITGEFKKAAELRDRFIHPAKRPEDHGALIVRVRIGRIQLKQLGNGGLAFFTPSRLGEKMPNEVCRLIFCGLSDKAR